MMMRLLFLLAGCWLPLGCPTPSAPDAGMPDAGPSDAGPSDAGLSDAGLSDAGPSDAGVDDAGCMDGSGAVPGDAGTTTGSGEGEGEGVCVPVHRATIAVQPNDAGVIPFESCFNVEYLYGDCPNACCGTSAAEQQTIELIRAVAAARGYEDRVEITRVREQSDDVVASIVYVVDWVRTVQRIDAQFDAERSIDRASIEAIMPAFLPESIAPLASAIEDLRTCAPDLLLRSCQLGLERSLSCGGWRIELWGYGGFESASCTSTGRTLWDSCAPDAGMGEVSCSNGEPALPCCLVD